MEPVAYSFSRLTLKSQENPEQNTTLPPEVLFQIFSLLNEASLRKAGLACRAWRPVAIDTRLWQPFAAQLYPEQAQVFVHLSNLARRPPQWHQFISRQYQAASLLRSPVTKNIKVLPDSPRPKKVYVDIDGSVYTILKGLQIEVSQESGKALFSLETVLNEKLRQASMSLCSIRTIGDGTKIAFLEIAKKGLFGLGKAKRVVAYDLSRRSIVWQSKPGAAYAFPGGANLGIGWELPVTAKTWNRRLHQARQQVAEEAFSLTFCTFQKALDAPSQQAFSIYRLDQSGDPITTLRLPKGEMVQHIDSNLSGSFFFVTASDHAESRHIVFARRNDGQYAQFSDVNVLAFDANRSIALLQFLGQEDAHAPIHLVNLIEQDGNLSLNFHTLGAIPPVAQYSAQIKGNNAAVLLRGQDLPALYLLPLFQPDRPEAEPVLLDPRTMPGHTIDSFTLYNDILILLTRKPDAAYGPLVVFDPASMKCRAVIAEPVTEIIAREAQTLLCQTLNGLIAVNLNSTAVTKLRDTTASRVYTTAIFSSGDLKPTLYELTKEPKC